MNKRKNLIVSIALSVAVLTSVATSTANASNTEVNVKNESSKSNFEKNEKFRKEFGLKSDSGYITNLLNDKTTKSSEKYGVILTKEEEIELDARFEMLRVKIPKIKEYISNKESKDNYANIYIDQASGGIINIGLKDFNPETERQIKSASGDSKVKIYKAKYSEKELDELHQKISDSREELALKNIMIKYIVTDIIKEKVVIAVEKTSDSVINTLGQMFNEDMISVIQDKSREKQDSSTYTRPVQGGLKIQSDNKLCTAGFSARDSSAHYIITAGHCISYTGEEWKQGGSLFAYTNKYQESGNVDAAALKIDPSNATAYLYAYRNLNFSKVVYVEQGGQETVGQTVCISGGNSDNTSCGTLQSKNWSGFLGTKYHYAMREASYSSIAGDSGSPIWAGFTIMGVHTAEGGIYTHVQNAINALGVYPVTTSP